MALVEWNESMSVGVQKIDEQHRSLLDILNELHTAIEAGRDREVLGTIIERLIQYTRDHFKFEEGLLQSAGYPDVNEHGAQHDSMITTALSAQAKFRWGTRPELASEMLEFLQNWLVHHIQGTDKEYSAHLHEHGIS